MTKVTVNTGNEDAIDVKLLSEGDMKAFDRLFYKYGNRLYSFAFGYLKVKEDSEGLVQDIFLKIWQQRTKLNNNQSFYSYLFTVARNHILNTIRQKAIDKKFQDYVLKNEFSADLNDEEDNFEALQSKLNKYIEQLPSMRKNVFILGKVEGLSYKEIASKLNISVKTVETHMSLSLKFLRENLKENTFSAMLFVSLFLG